MAIEKGTRNGILITIATGVILAALGFTFRNASLPRQEKEMEEIRLDIKDITTRQNADQLEKEGMKKDIKFTQETVIDLKEDFKEGLKDISNQIRELRRENNGRH